MKILKTLSIILVMTLMLSACGVALKGSDYTAVEIVLDDEKITVDGKDADGNAEQDQNHKNVVFKSQLFRQKPSEQNTESDRHQQAPEGLYHDIQSIHRIHKILHTVHSFEAHRNPIIIPLHFITNLQENQAFHQKIYFQVTFSCHCCIK